jgi:hypothetical protein
MYATATYFGNCKVGDVIVPGLPAVRLEWIALGSLKPPVGSSLVLELLIDGSATGISCTLQSEESASETSLVGREVPAGKCSFVIRSVGSSTRGGYLTVVLKYAE